MFCFLMGKHFFYDDDDGDDDGDDDDDVDDATFGFSHRKRSCHYHCSYRVCAFEGRYYQGGYPDVEPHPAPEGQLLHSVYVHCRSYHCLCLIYLPHLDVCCEDWNLCYSHRILFSFHQVYPRHFLRLHGLLFPL